MDINITITQENDVSIIALTGDIDASTAPKVQESVVPLAESGGKILMDMTHVPYMSSAGLRMLNVLYKKTTTKNTKLVLVAVADNIQDTMSVTGFLDFFVCCETKEEGLAKLNA